MSANNNAFDLTNPVVVTRITLGVLYLPHIAFKLSNMEGAATFFGKAGFEPAMLFVVLALITETACAAGFIFNILTKWVGLMSAAVMGVAAYAVVATKGAHWLWNLGGIEYIALWGFLSLVLAAHAWREERKDYGHSFLLFPHAA